jgi:tetratricopeptide (TPR) repeat protein
VSAFWSRIHKGRLFQVLAIYLGASWLVLQVADALTRALSLPEWVTPAAILLLLAGLLVVLATAWIQSHPLVKERAAAEEVPHAWELDLSDVRASLRRRRFPHLTWARALGGGAAVFLLLFGLAGVYVVIGSRDGDDGPAAPEAAGALPGLAVLPFEVAGAGLDVWREGMVDLLSTNLDGVAGLRTINSRTILARWRERVVDGVADLPTVLEVARATGARYALVGSAVALGGDVRLTAELYDVGDRRSLGSARAEGPAADVLRLVDELSVDVLRSVVRVDVDAGYRNVARLTTSSLPALRAYLEGEVLFRRAAFEAAAEAYERAIAADSTFALAAYRLSTAYGWTATSMDEQAQRYAALSNRHAEALPAREAALVRATVAALRNGDPEGVGALRDLAARYPDDPEVWYELGEAYMHSGGQALASPEDAEAAFSRSIALDSAFLPAYIHAVELAVGRRDTARVRGLLATYERLSGATGESGAELRRWLDRSWALARFVEEPTLPDDLDELPTSDLVGGMGSLMRGGPRNLPVLLPLVERIATRRDLPPQLAENVGGGVLYVKAQLGRVRDALAGDDRARPLQRFALRYYLAREGVPVDEDDLARAAAAAAEAAATAADTPAVDWFLIGSYAVDRPDPALLETAMRHLREPTESVEGEADRSGAADALQAYIAWRRAPGDATLRELMALQRRVTGHEAEGLNVQLRRGIAEGLVALGRPREALVYYRAIDMDVFALFRRAELHHQLGDAEEARELYNLVLEIWSGADADLPHLASARRALQRLTADA